MAPLHMFYLVGFTVNHPFFPKKKNSAASSCLPPDIFIAALAFASLGFVLWLVFAILLGTVGLMMMIWPHPIIRKEGATIKRKEGAIYI